MINSDNISTIIKFGLENIHIFNNKCKQVNVKEVLIINEDSLCCSFYSKSSKSNDIKLEISVIMGFLNGLFREEKYDDVNFNYYAVRAYNENDEEILYALSTKSTAELIGTGKSIEWLKLTLFQENTAEYRLSRAKQIISEIENCLREIVKKTLKQKFGENWWDESLNNKLGKEVKSTYMNQFGEEINNGDILIYYTYTLQLKKIISTHFNLFKQFFKNLSEFDNDMDCLNKIRREEAHNREISGIDLENLEKLHENLTSKILLELTELQSVFLTENWRIKIKKIMAEEQYKIIHSEEDVKNEENLFVKLTKIKQNLSHSISYLNDTIIKLKSVVTPIHKKDIHKELIANFQELKDLRELLLIHSETLDEEKIEETTLKINEHFKQMRDFSNNLLLSEN